MASPATWGWPPLAEVAGRPLRLSATWRTRGPRIPRASLSPPNPGDGREVVRSENESSRKAKKAVVGLKSLRKRPLWKRIFFASKKVRSLILLNVIAVVDASGIPVLKEVEMIMDPALFTAVRFALTAVPFLPFVLKARGDRQICSAGIELGIWVSLGYLCEAIGLLTSEAGRATFISALTVIIVPLMDGLFGATVATLTWIGALSSLVGVTLLECDGSIPVVGDILNLMSAIFFGIHMLRTEHISRCTKREKFLSLLGYEVFVVAFSSTIWFSFREIVGDSHQLSSGSWTWSSMGDWIISFPWIPALYTGLFSTGLCLWAEIDAMCDTSASESAIIYSLEPVWGATFAWFLLGERWSTIEWIGAAFILGGSLIVQLLGSSPEEPRKVDGTSTSSPSNLADKQNNLSMSRIIVDSKENELYRKSCRNRKDR